MMSQSPIFLSGLVTCVAFYSLTQPTCAASIPLGLQSSPALYPRPLSSQRQGIDLGISDTRLLFGELLHATFTSDVAVVDEWLYMSWANAARVDYLVVETSQMVFPSDDNENATFKQLKSTKMGDMNAVDICLEQDLHVRLVAMDEGGQILGATESVEIAKGTTTISITLGDSKTDARRLLVLGLAMMCFGIIFAWLTDEFGRRKRETANAYTSMEIV